MNQKVKQPKEDGLTFDWCWINNGTDQFNGVVKYLFASYIIATHPSLSLACGCAICNDSFVSVTLKTLIKG